LKKELVAQQSFAGGQINKSAWRRDDVAALKTGSERQENMRVSATEQAEPRPGRRMFCKVSGPRNEYVRVSGLEFLLSFGNGSLQIISLATGLQVFSAAPLAWGPTTLAQIVWTAADNDIHITFPGMQPQIARYDPIAATWSLLAYGFLTVTNQVQEPFYRFAKDGVTVSWVPATYTYGSGGALGSPVLGQTGLAVVLSAPWFASSMVNTRLSILGQQATIATVTDGAHATVNVPYVLPTPLSVLVDNTDPFVTGLEVQLKVQGVKGEVGTVSKGTGTASPGGTVTFTVTSSALYPGATTTLGEQLISPLGYANVPFGPTVSGVASTVQWQEEFMSGLRGWPSACAFGRRRLRFYNFPQKQDAILWSTIDHPDMMWVDAVAAALYPQAGTEADNAFLEFVGDDEGAPKVLHVVDWGDEFIFTDRGIYQLPISAAGNPLKPGSAEFRKLSNDGVSTIPPIVTADSIVFINAGKQRVSALKGAPLSTSARPFIVDDVSEPHSDLFTNPIAMALTTGDGPKPERYIYVLNNDGSVVVGKFTADRQFVGWAPWTSQVLTVWVTSAGPNVWYTVQHGSEFWIETEDMTIDLDSGVYINALPTSVSASQPGGKGPLWYLANRTVALVDMLPAGPLDKGDYAVDANGFLVPNQPGEDLTSATLYAGLTVSVTHVPLVPMPGQGESTGQRQHRRKVSRLEVTFQGQQAPFKIGKREVSPYKFGDDQSAPATPRDGSDFIRPLGRAYDPQNNAITKTRPGPVRWVEVSQEVTI